MNFTIPAGCTYYLDEALSVPQIAKESMNVIPLSVNFEIGEVCWYTWNGLDVWVKVEDDLAACKAK